jgi:heat induced stress protein YflT
MPAVSRLIDEETMRTITGLFDTYDHATQAVRLLKDAGIPGDDISLVANNSDGLIKEEGHAHSETSASKGAGLGVATGAGVGLLAGLGALAIPGIGPVVAGGWLLSTAIGAALGLTSGGILGALLKAGVSEEDAHVYAEGVRRGGTLVTARVDEARADSLNAILQSAQGVDIGARRQEYAAEGWERFDERSEPYVPTANSVPAAGVRRL